jgi:WD40 repeat protein
LRTVLDAELARLPDKLRSPLVLCYLEGRSQEEAARQLGWSKSTLLRRLEEARAALGRRLTRKGFVWPAAVSAVLLSDCVAPAALPPKLVGSTVEAVAAGVAPTQVTALAEGVMKVMFVSKMKPALPAALLGGALIAGALAFLAEGLTGPPGLAAAQPPQDSSKPVSTPPGVPAIAARKPVVVREDEQVRRVAWSADGKIVATVNTSYEVKEVADSDGKNSRKVLAGRNAIKLWDATTGKLMKSLGEENGARAVTLAFSPDKKHLAVMGDVGEGAGQKRGEATRRFVKVLDTETWAVKQELNDDDLNGVGYVLAFSPDGNTLALGGASPLAEKGSVVKLWDLGAKKVTTAVKFSAPPLADAKPTLPPKPPEWMVMCLTFSPDGKVLAAGEYGMGSKRARIQLYDAKTAEPKRGWEVGEAKGMIDVAFTADGKRLLSANGAVKLWDADTGKELTTLETKGEEGFRVGPSKGTSLLEVKGREFFRIAVSPDGRLLATSGVRKEKDKSIPEVCVWGAKGDGGLSQVVTWDDPALWASSLAFSPDGKTLAVGAQTDADAKVKGSEKVKGELRLISLGGGR